MNLIDLKNEIMSNQFDNLYYFTGEDWKLRNIYINKIAYTSNKTVRYVDSVDDILTFLKQGTIFAKRNCFVVYEDKKYLIDEKAWDKLANLIQNDIVIFVYNELDKRSKFYKQFKDTLVEFSHMNDNILINNINNAIKLSNENCERIIKACNNDYGKILFEIDKIQHYLPLDYNKSCEMLFNAHIIQEQPTGTIFDLVDAIIKHDPDAIKIYQECKNKGENNLAILQALFNKTKAVLQVQSYKGNDLYNATGLKSGVIWGCKKLIGYCTKQQLINIMKVTQNIEESIKNGNIQENIAIDYLLTLLLI